MRYLGLFLLTVCILLAQSSATKEDTDVKLPNGKSQKDEIIRVDYERNLKDAGDLAQLAQEIKDDFERGDRNLVSLKTFLREQEQAYLNRAMQQCGGDKEQAALALGVSLATLYRKLSGEDKEA